jgi:galactonate dehydratase
MRLTGLTTYRTPVQPNLCILALESDQGAVGLGESFWGAPAVDAYLHETAAPVLASMEDHAPAVVAAALSPYSGFDGSGAETRGNGAVDIALWDLLGRHSGQPVMRLLGGPMAPRVRVYNTCAGYEYVRTDGGPYSTEWWGLPDAGSETRPYEDLEGFMLRPAELTRSLMDEGYTGMKVWPFDPAAARSRGHDISSAELRSAMSVVEAIRAEAGDAMDILIEMHSLWSLKAATRILKALEDIAPFWVEDPMRLDSVDGYRRLRERVDVPIAGGEPLTGARRFKPLLDAGALDVAIVDPGWTGGITETVRIASLADTYGVSFAPHDCTGPISFAATVQVVASQPNGVIAETVRASQASWYPQIATGLPQVSEGHVQLTEAPGLGVSLREEFTAHPETKVRTTSLV